jgi:hypothetical protein
MDFQSFQYTILCFYIQPFIIVAQSIRNSDTYCSRSLSIQFGFLLFRLPYPILFYNLFPFYFSLNLF